MRDVVRARRRVDRVLSRLAADYGRVEVVSRRWDCDPGDRDAVAATVAALDRAGGASALVRDGSDAVLLVRYADAEGWSGPGTTITSGETYEDCARRAVAGATGFDVTITDVAQVHVRHATDWMPRDPVPEPTVVFEADLAGRGSENPEPGRGIAEVAWFDECPDDLLYDELADLLWVD